MSPARPRAAWTVCFVDLGLLTIALVFGLQTFFAIPFVGYPLAGAIAAVIAAFVASKTPENRNGWLLLAFATTTSVNVSFFQITVFLASRDIGGLPLTQGVAAIGLVAFAGSSLTLPLLLLTFPDGRLPTPRWKPIVGVLIAMATIDAGASVLVAGNITDPSAFVATLETGGAEGVVVPDWATNVFTIWGAVLVVTFVASAGSLLMRLRRATGEERQQIKWVVYTGVVTLLLFPVDLVRSSSEVVWFTQQVVSSVGALALPLGFGLALLKYRLWDIDLVIRRSAIYGFLWLLITGAYLAVSAGLGLVAGATFPVEVAIALTAVTTVVFLPARRWLEKAADRWVLGRTRSPVEAVQGLGEVLGTTDRPAEIATQLARTAVGAVGLAAVEVTLDQSSPITVGTPTGGETIVFPVRRGEETFGEMSCLPHPGRRLSDSDVELLEAMASQAGLALAHIRLASRIVHTQDAERRRIERDIHDGAQQDLATLVAQLGLARAQVDGDEPTGRILSEVQTEVQRILGNLRELAQGIHPSVLRDGGLAAVARDRCSRLPIQVNLDIDPDLRSRRFTNDVEGAAYFFLSEALANVLKHSRSEDVTVRLGTDSGDLQLEVSDSGVGIGTDTSIGTGLRGLSDRIEALGGTFMLRNRPNGGVAVSARLPVPQVSAETK